METRPSHPPAPAGPVMVRRAGEAELVLARMLLGPKLGRSLAGAAVWLAFSGAPQRIAGAAACYAAGGAFFWVRVAKPFRRHGVGTALTAAVSEHALRGGATSLTPVRGVRTGVARRFLRANGFRRRDRMRLFQVRLSDAREQARSVIERLGDRHPVPEGARVISLGEAHREWLLPGCAELISRSLGGRADAMLARMSGSMPPAFDAQGSKVVVDRGAVVGVMVVTRQKRSWMFDGIAIDPAHRLGWANLRLRHACFETLWAERHSDRMRFLARDNALHTLGFARRMKARLLGGRYTYVRRLTPAGESRP